MRMLLLLALLCFSSCSCKSGSKPTKIETLEAIQTGDHSYLKTCISGTAYCWCKTGYGTNGVNIDCNYFNALKGD